MSDVAVVNNSKNPKKRTRSVVRAEELAAKKETLAKVLSLVTEGGYFNTQDVPALEQTWKDVQNWGLDKTFWKPMALKTWPHLATLLSEQEGEENLVRGRRPVIAGQEIPSYKSIFCDPRWWLAVSADRVKRLPKWSETMHLDVECGKCGCNCCNGIECPGIEIKSEYRWEKKGKSRGWPENRMEVPDGEGYEHSGGAMIMVDRFCEPCFDRLVQLDIIQSDDYCKTRGKTLFDLVTTEMIEATTEQQNEAHRHHITGPCYFTPFFASGSEWSWQELHKKVKADDVAIVVAHALIQEGCKTRFLQLDGIHFNDPGFGSLGYKALAFALAINKTVRRIDFYHDWDCDGCFCCYSCRDRPSFSYAADVSSGLFLKALQHNKESALEELPLLCPSAFGPKTWQEWKEVKPSLNCGPTFYSEVYKDIEEYDSEDEEGDY